MENPVRTKRAFEIPETAPYKRQVLPRLDAQLGVPADPRRLAPPTDPSLPSGMPTPIPTTSASNKKTNVQIPYIRVTRDAEALGIVGEPLFVRADVRDPLVASMPDEKLDAVAGMEAVNAELATQLEDEDAWRVTGILLSTESEMDPILQEIGVRNTSTTTTVLESVQGPTQLRNLYSARPLVGDWVYIGLVWGGDDAPGYRWVPFSSQHLDMDFVPEEPRDPKLGFAGHGKHSLLRVGFGKEQRQRLCRAVCLGRVIDSAPSPGMITVHVSIREMTIDELGRRHDEEHVTYRSSLGPEVRWPHGRVEQTQWEYQGDIGRRSPKRVANCLASLADAEDPADDDVLRIADQLVRLPAEAMGADLLARLGSAARALASAEYEKRLDPVCSLVSALVPRLLEYASTPTLQPDAETRAAMERAALEFELFLTLAEGLAPSATSQPIRVMALQRTAPQGGEKTVRRDPDRMVWLLQKVAVVAAAVESVFSSSL